MKYLSEYRGNKAVQVLLKEIESTTTRPWTIMEICGGQTHSLVKNGILDLLPGEIAMVHGPGCPVCVTPVEMIDHAVELALSHEVTICSFGDMLRVPGSSMSLLKAKARGGDIRMVYSPLEAVTLARDHPELQVAFFAVGFETTAPANALSVLMAKELNVTNYTLLVSHVLVPPAMETILTDEENRIEAFLAAGHVCTVTGYEEYYPLAKKYGIPIIVTGFEPVDLLRGILMAIKQLESGQHIVENAYARVVNKAGNPETMKVIEQVFTIADRNWRGIGTIPKSGYELRGEFKNYDALQKYGILSVVNDEIPNCMAGLILKGLKKPHDCSEFGKGCSPIHPMGASMVSSEGACAAYFHYAQHKEKV